MVELLRHEHIQLDRATLPGTANGITQMEINLRAIECAIAFIDDILQATMLQGITQCIRRLFPDLVRAHGIIRTRGKLCRIGKTERAVYFIEEVDRMLDLFFDLRWRQEQMCIILREIADTEQAVKLTRFLMTMHETELTKAQRQITIAVLMRLINQHAARAVHRLDRIIFIVNLREVHVLHNRQ